MPAMGSTGGRDCGYTFVRYVPSPWESEWLQAGAARQDSICATMKQELARSEAWIAAANESYFVNDAGVWARQQEGSEVFSFFEYRQQCGRRVLKLPIEPLVGLMRHPFATSCAPPGHVAALDPRHSFEGATTRK